MKNNKEVKISYWAAHLTTIVSVTLVLIIIGIIALISITATSETRRLREKLEVSVVMSDTISDGITKAISERIAVQPYALGVKVITKDEALKNWKNDTGEDLEALFGVNPLSPEITFSVKSDYATEAELKKIEEYVTAIPGVEGVALPDSAMVESMNRNIEKFALILGVIALVMIIISFVLINNTVHLAIYARRFTIHTMQLVGATNGFIRRPFVNNNMLSGLIAGILAAGLIAISLAAAPNAGFTDVSKHITWEMFAIVGSSLVVAGVLLCGVAAWFATSRYLHQDYDELFK
ncbi:MAG: permease-like cell division protein FtsX [Muribaculaceae bacterium]|nr:permease-like cell division protein FtsX [Muribaculaceae bacterium]